MRRDVLLNRYTLHQETRETEHAINNEENLVVNA